MFRVWEFTALGRLEGLVVLNPDWTVGARSMLILCPYSSTP